MRPDAGPMGGPHPLDAVRGVLDEARDLGFLGPGPVDAHVGHALAFAEAWGSSSPVPPRRWADLGTGGGPPGLVLAAVWPDTTGFLIESTERRAGFLGRAVESLGLGSVQVLHRRAEEAGRIPELRGTLDLVVARGFGRPGVTAECAAPLLRPEGALIVSEPPDPDEHRWPEAGLAGLGMNLRGRWTSDAGFVLIAQEQPCPDRFPRRAGIPAKRPLF